MAGRSNDEMHREAIIRDVPGGQYDSPLRGAMFNSRDVSPEIAAGFVERCEVEGYRQRQAIRQ